MAGNLWTITSDDRRRHDEQFQLLKPINGFITGDQAREFFFKSNLPATILAQIWDLADVNKDGKMDRREFSIAMYLIQKKLQGVQLPPILPESMKIESTSASASINYQGMLPLSQNISYSNQTMNRPWLPPSMAPPTMIPQPMMMMAQPITMQPTFYGSTPTIQSAISPSPLTTNAHVDWSMPQASKLKYSLQFNTLDKDKSGFLSGAQARSYFGHSDLPSQTLAKIWYLSDLDKDGRLTADEFAIASHLIDSVKRGAALPSTLPQELAPSNWHRAAFRHQRTASFGSEDMPPMSPKSSASFSHDGGGDLIKAPRMMATFEDKRRQNLERGQAEIERRRMLLQEQETREREARERKQREERERLEREREEQERRRQQEIERHQAKLRQDQEKRDAEYKRMLEQKEAARQEAERQRQSELDRQRLQDLRNQRQREQEAVCHSKQRHKNLSFQLQALTEKAHELNERITSMRDKVGNATSSFEMMKAVRDKTLLEIENGKRRVQDLRTKSMQIENEKLNWTSKKRSVVGGSTTNSAAALFDSYKNEETKLEAIRRSLADVEQQVQRKQIDIQNKEKSSKLSIDRARTQATEYRELVQRVNAIMVKVRQAKNISTSQPAAGASWKSKNGHREANDETAAKTVHYRVVYDFDAQNDAELTLRVGDVVVVFVDHHGDEGWLAGQIGEKVGWFPRDFAQPLDDEASISETTISRMEENRSQIERQEIDLSAAISKPSERRESIDGQWYVAIYAFVAVEAGDLGFEIGDRILVVQKNDDWWTGRIDDREGIFPSNYVQELDSVSAAVVAEEPIVEQSVVVEQQSIVEQSVINRSREQKRETPSVVVEEVVENAEPEREDTVYEVAQAIAQYQAADASQLTLEIGDLIKIRSKSPTGWWEGEVQRKGERQQIGWFPGTYVEILAGGSNAEGSNSKVEQDNVGSANGEDIVEALFDYTKQVDDELSFAKGSAITILERLDDNWWRGRLADGQTGLLPANYVKNGSTSLKNGDAAVEESRQSSASSTPTGELRKRSMYCQELEQTEQNYVDDLQMVVDVFYKQLESSGLLAPKEISMLFINWTELIAVARSFVSDLRSSSEDRIGATILKNMENLKGVFVTFCRHQQSALDFLVSKEKASARFRALHAQCSQHPAARGLQLSYFLLIPLARVTKYHLVVKEILKYTPNDHGDHENLRTSHAALRQLCDAVNEVATETENLQMLYWCQNHVKCDSIQPKLVFHSPTNNFGPRRFVHSGVFFKTTSNRLLVGLLFNDFLMLTTPDEKINQPETFKLNRQSELALVLYKAPILLSKASLQPSTASNSNSSTDGQNAVDECVIVLHYGEDAIGLRAVSSNAKILWTKQLDKTIRQARELGPARSRSVTVSSSGIGRLLLEVVFVRNLVVPQDCKGASFYIEFAFDQQKHTKSIDLSRTDTLCTTQIVLDSKNGSMKLAIFAERIYSPDICVGRTEMELGSMLKMSGSQRNPAVKQLPLTSDFSAQSDTVSGHIIVKFVVQLFDDQ